MRCLGLQYGSLVLVGLALSLALPAGIHAATALSIEAVLVAPVKPAADTLCSLKARLKNSGAREISGFRFKVKIDGREVSTYEKQLYVITVAPGATSDISLYNFWTPSQPKSDAIDVEVSVIEAQWAETKTTGNTSSLSWAGSVEGLPVTAATSVKLSK